MARSQRRLYEIQVQAGQGMRSDSVPANGLAGDSHQPFRNLSGLCSHPLHSCLCSLPAGSGKVLGGGSSSPLSAGLPGVHLAPIPCHAAGSGLPNSGTGERWWRFSCWMSGQDFPEEKPTMVRLCHGAECGDACKDVPKGGFISVGSWTGLCFGEGEVPLWLTAPSTFSSHSHLNWAVFSKRWRPSSSKHH